MSRRTASTRKIRYAVIGSGHIAQIAVLPGFKTATRSELAAIVSGDPEKREKLRKQYRLERVYRYEEYDRALAEVDAVYLTLPNHLHCEYAVRAAQAHVHVLCEKPMAVTEEECQTMLNAAKENGIKLMIAYRLHFEAGNLEAIRLAQGGTLGNLRFFASELLSRLRRVMFVSPRVSKREAARFTTWECTASMRRATCFAMNPRKCWLQPRAMGKKDFAK